MSGSINIKFNINIPDDCDIDAVCAEFQKQLEQTAARRNLQTWKTRIRDMSSELYCRELEAHEREGDDNE